MWGIGHTLWELVAGIAEIFGIRFGPSRHELGPEETSIDDVRRQANESVRDSLGIHHRWPR